MTRTLYYADHCPIPLPPQHKFPIEKYRILREMLIADAYFQLQPAPFADRSDVELVHDPKYVDAFLRGTLSDAAMRKIGFPWSEMLVRRTMASVGGTLAATRQALATGWGGTLAGGTHHAFAGEGAGFCVFNDIAIAIAKLRSAGLVRRAAVVDLDVHQGDGTAHIFRDQPEVLTLSIHCRNNFPLRKQQSTIDIELDAGIEDQAYLEILQQVLVQVQSFKAEIVFYQSGVDGLESDALGKLSLTLAGLKERDRMLMEFARDLRIPLVMTLGGGYSRPIALTAEAHANTFRTAAQVLNQHSVPLGCPESDSQGTNDLFFNSSTD
ncbi:MAG TPA: histone deacetylase [Terriglobales bacterium]|nr:histone deacetylase [Terriglobales bacterium]